MNDNSGLKMKNHETEKNTQTGKLHIAFIRKSPQILLVILQRKKNLVTQ